VPKDIFKAISEWDDKKRSLIVEIGLAGILEIDNILFVNRDFSQWLLQRIDSAKGVLKLGRNETVYLSELHVSWILGIRYGGSIDLTRTDGHPSCDQIKECRRVLGIDGSSEEITVNELLSVLMQRFSSPMTEDEKIKVKVGFVMLCCTVFFSPRNKRYVVPKDGYDMVRDPALLNQINWGKYILDEIYSGAKQVQAAIDKGRNRFNVYGCLLFLQVQNIIIIYFKIPKFHNLTILYLFF
jgi:hypothetical protein